MMTRQEQLRAYAEEAMQLKGTIQSKAHGKAAVLFDDDTFARALELCILLAEGVLDLFNNPPSGYEDTG